MLDLNTNKGYFVHLISCALKNEKPIEKPENVDFEALYQIALSQNLLNLIWYSIEKLDNKPNEEIANKWTVTSAKLLSQMAYQEFELENLISAFSSNGYKMMPLKGFQIKSYYPEPDMRTMGDIDLLLQSDGSQASRNKVKDLMLSMGYQVDLLNDGQVDSYKKPNDVEIEIHFEFMAPNHPHYNDFIIDWNALLPTENPSVFKMSVDDLYYFNIGHFVKNMSTKGNGIKPIVDAYVLWNNMSNEQKDIVNERLEKANLKTVNDKILLVADIWFNNASDDGATENIQEYILNNSVYGCEKNREIKNVMLVSDGSVKSNLVKKYFSRVFPSPDSLYKRFNIKHRVFLLLPFLWLIRIILLPFKSKENKEKIMIEIEKANSVTEEEIKFFKSVYDDFGLDITI